MMKAMLGCGMHLNILLGGPYLGCKLRPFALHGLIMILSYMLLALILFWAAMSLQLPSHMIHWLP